jgi:serine/threonine protein kinase
MNTVPMPNRCPKCAAPLPSDAPQGLCAKCLLLAAATPTETGAGPAVPAHLPSLEAVQAAFPQLEIIELIGAGGMGAVFKARQPKLDRCVALKVLSPSLATSPAFAERFNREARVLARLNHPGIVNVFDFGVAEQPSNQPPAGAPSGAIPAPFYFLLMEFVDGVNLRQAMQAGRFTPSQALALVPKICEALQFAHDEGILHRDIKPENILLDTKGRVKIADFGIAKLVSEPQPVTKLTATGAAIGTPQYMAPEQIEHPEDVDQRADIYSLGVVFYEMLTGELPIGRFAPPSEKSPVDARVDAVVFRTLEKERERRYGSAGEVKTSVEHLTSAPPPVPAAAALAFDPAEDFILCPPELPRMAKAIIVYALTVAPVVWLLSLFTLEPLPDHPLVGFVQMVVNVLTYGLDFLLVILLAIGGGKLRGLRPSAVNWLRTAIWLRIGCGLLVIGGALWVEALASQFLPDAPVPRPHLSDGLVIAFGLAALVFEISALVWLHRHSRALRTVCEAAQKPAAPTPLRNPGPPAPASFDPTAERVAPCYVSTPEHVRSFVGRFLYIYQGKGELRLNATSLQFTRKWQSVTIPLGAITGLGLGHYAPEAKPAKLYFVQVSFTEHGRNRTLLFTPCESALAPAWDTNRIVQDWHDAIQAAVRARTGLTPPTAEGRVLADTRRPGWLLPAMLAAVCLPALVAWVLVPLITQGRLPVLGWDLLGFMGGFLGVALVFVFVWWWWTRRQYDQALGSRPASPNGAQDALRRWSIKSVVGAVLAGISLPLALLGGLAMATRAGGVGGPEVLVLILTAGTALLLGLTATILGWMGLSDIREHAGRMRGLPFAVFAALAWPLGALVGGTVVAPYTVLAWSASDGAARYQPPWFVFALPAGVLTFAVWSVWAAARWGSNRPVMSRRGVLKWVFAAVLLSLIGFAASRQSGAGGSRTTITRFSPQTGLGSEPAAGGLHTSREAGVVVLASPRENFIVTATVWSNGVSVGHKLRTKLWPPDTREPTTYGIGWQALPEAGPAPWEIVVVELAPKGGDKRIVARLRPEGLPPQLDWQAVHRDTEGRLPQVSSEARTFELARALQTTGGGNAGAADWSVRLQLQSQPPQPTESRRGVEADFVLPANQVAVFEVVTRSNGVVAPVSGLSAHLLNGANEPYKGKFLWADDPDDLDSQTALPRWSFGLVGEGDRLLETGLGVPTPPAGYTGWLTLWTELQPDTERLEGLSDADPARPAYGLRIRTQTVRIKPGLHYHSSGFGTNWMKEAASHLAAPEK